MMQSWERMLGVPSSLLTTFSHRPSLMGYVKADVELHSDFESDLGSALVGEISFAWLDTAAVGL